MRAVTTAERPDLADEAALAFRERWPEFIFHGEVPRESLGRVHRHFPEGNILLLDQGRVVAGGRGVPFSWDGSVGGPPHGVRRGDGPGRRGARGGRKAEHLQFHGRVRGRWSRRARTGDPGAARADPAVSRGGVQPGRGPAASDVEAPFPTRSGGGIRPVDPRRRPLHRPVDSPPVSGWAPPSWEPPGARWSSKGRWPSGKPGREWSFRSRGATWCRKRSIWSTSTVTGTGEPPWKKTSGSSTPGAWRCDVRQTGRVHLPRPLGTVGQSDEGTGLGAHKENP